MDSKNILTSLSFWGLLVSFVTPFLAKHGIVVDAGSLASTLVTVAGGLLGLYGIFRRKDIAVLPK
jgi:hypothetical protein